MHLPKRPKRLFCNICLSPVPRNTNTGTILEAHFMSHSQKPRFLSTQLAPSQREGSSYYPIFAPIPLRIKTRTLNDEDRPIVSWYYIVNISEGVGAKGCIIKPQTFFQSFCQVVCIVPVVGLARDFLEPGLFSRSVSELSARLHCSGSLYTGPDDKDDLLLGG